VGDSISLDLGGALTAYGLIFAVYQLRRESWDIVLRIRDPLQKQLFWVLGFIGLFLTVIGIVVSKHPIFPLNTLNLALPYDLAAFLCFISSPLALLYFSTSVGGLFSRNTADRFYSSLIQELSRTSESDINAALDVLLPNFTTICRAAVNDPESTFSQRSRAIIDVVLSDGVMVKILTTKRLDALRSVFAAVEEASITEKLCDVAIPRIVRSLLQNSDSFLYKHRTSEGLALSSDIFHSIFDSRQILIGYDLFSYPTLDYDFPTTINKTGVDVFILALSRSIDTYFGSQDVPALHINRGLSQLSQIFEHRCGILQELQGHEDSGSITGREAWAVLEAIAKFLGRHCSTLTADLRKPIEMTARAADFYSNVSISAGIAAAIYKAIESLSWLESSFKSYQVVLTLVNGMEARGELVGHYRELFSRRMWEQVGVNVARSWYPVAVRAYLQVIGFHLVSNLEKNDWIREQTERMRRLLYVDLRPRFDSDARMINGEKMSKAFLPTFMTYEKGRFLYRGDFGRGAGIEIIPPPVGSVSALDGIELETLPDPLI
jgi:hypothetical protein